TCSTGERAIQKKRKQTQATDSAQAAAVSNSSCSKAEVKDEEVEPFQALDLTVSSASALAPAVVKTEQPGGYLKDEVIESEVLRKSVVESHRDELSMDCAIGCTAEPADATEGSSDLIKQVDGPQPAKADDCTTAEEKEESDTAEAIDSAKAATGKSVEEQSETEDLDDADYYDDDLDDDSSIYDVDASAWTIEEVADWLRARGFAEAAAAFRTQEIDGEALMLLRRGDVLACLGLRLGPAVKLFQCVCRLQAASQLRMARWACGN
uniref:SAM domain-containing protein n=2 Tax=Macrostomum lignano TaxID=282301 RepID=A0A1I8GMK8_9PLAT